MSSVVVDTNVLSFDFKGVRAELYHRHLVGQLLVVSFMTIAELDLWALERQWGQVRKRRMEEYLGRCVVYPFNRILCAQWAKVMHEVRKRGRKMDASDAWIAATAISAGAPLVTHNPDDFFGIDGLRLLSSVET